ncbi:MAG: nitrite/sulfite reductase [Pseudomonadota bacterium]|nr:nitrite/sulfite reductase [Pseudomonadota bacterium]
MYQYSEKDKQIVKNRTKEFLSQVNRRINGDLTEDEFKPLRLMNGLYLQLHAYMLRVAIPYGELSFTQLNKLAEISKKYDRGYGHFTTRQNIQFNWPKLEDVPKILDELSEVEMHAIQTSGNCIRNISCDHLAGINNEEVEDPRPWCEIIRKWSTFHPEFSFLPRKFKIAVIACETDRAAMKVHDIGLKLKKKKEKIGFEVFVGGGQGRSPFIAKKINDFVKKKDILNYLEAILSVYNELGRRDNIYKARIKILINELGEKKLKSLVNDKFKKFADRKLLLKNTDIEDIKKYFKLPIDGPTKSKIPLIKNKEFNFWLNQNVIKHKFNGYSIIIISLKHYNQPPGDATAEQMKELSKISQSYSFGEIRVTHEQNLVLPHIKNSDLYDVWVRLKKIKLTTPNIGLITDTICCPGMDYCALATARSIPISQKISRYFKSKIIQKKIGNIKIKISGCINACGHHHVGNIGILGLDKNGEESYQISLGGSSDERTNIGQIVGPSFPENKLIKAINTILKTFENNKKNKKEDFLSVFNRIGIDPFKNDLYETNNSQKR